MHFLQAINSDISVLIVCNKTGGTIKGDKKKIFTGQCHYQKTVKTHIKRQIHNKTLYIEKRFEVLKYINKCYFTMLFHCFYVRNIPTGTASYSGPRQLSRFNDPLRAGRSGDRIPVVARFSASALTGLGGPPSLLYNGYRVFPGGKAAGASR